MSIKPKRAFITGVYGQDGSYLAEHLLDVGYEVLGLVHESDATSPQASLLSGRDGFTVHVGDLCILESYRDALASFMPDEIYNIAAVSDLKTAKEKPEHTLRVNFVAFTDLVAYATTINSEVRIFQALSSRILTPDTYGVITESSPLAEPKNAYDEAKRNAYENVVLPYREKGFFIASGFLCNHESPRRGERFVTGKIAGVVARMSNGSDEVLDVGNIEAKRDWSFAGDIVRAMYATLQTKEPHDYVIGSGELHTVKEFIEFAFQAAGKKISWNGDGLDTKGFDELGVLRVLINPQFYQPDDNPVVSSTQFLEHTTPWKRELSFNELVSMMVRAEIEKL